MLYRTPPSDFKKQLDVVGCFVEHDGMLLLLKRQTHKTSGDAWGMPAGKVDAGETMTKAMSRELHEETGLLVPEDALQYFISVFVRHAEHDFLYHMFSCSCTGGPDVKINPEEHQEFVWVTPQAALNMELMHDTDECIRMFFKL